jgi:hypothetical protein
LFCLELRCVHSYYHLVSLVSSDCSVGYLSDLVDYSTSSRTWCPSLNTSVKLHTLHESVVLAGVIVLLGLCDPPRRGCGELAKPWLLYPLVWIPCNDTISEKLGSQSRVDNIASDLESWVTCCDRQD